MNLMLQAAIASSRRRTPPSSYLFSDNLEYANEAEASTGFWTSNNSPSWGYATSPAPLEGARSLAFTNSSQSASLTLPTAQPELWISFLLNVSFVNGNNFDVSFYDGANTEIAHARVLSTGIWSANSGGGVNTNSSAGEIEALTTYWMKLKYKAGTGADAKMAIYSSTDGVWDATPTVIRGGGTSTTAAAKVFFSTLNAGVIIVDRLRISSTDMGDMPV
jgi:hypothetical protein